MAYRIIKRFLAILAIVLLITACGGGGGSTTGGGTDTSAWTLMESGTTKTLNAVWGTSATNIYAAGVDSTLFHFNGSVWSEIPGSEIGLIPGNGTGTPDIWGTSSSNIYMTGKNGNYHYDGVTWRFNLDITLPSFISIWASSATDIYAVSFDNKLYHSADGSSWSLVSTGLTYLAAQVRGSGPDDVYVAGNPTLHYDGTWSSVLDGLAGGTERVAVVSSTSVYVLGQDMVHHFDGTGWASTSHGLSRDEDIWASSDTNIYVTGKTDDSQMGMAHFDGSTWTAIPDETSSGLEIYALWGASSTDIFGVGSQGKIIRYEAP